ncbi:hypothetical protein SRHO_G00149370 [Serrasalmus rhombeus]
MTKLVQLSTLAVARLVCAAPLAKTAERVQTLCNSQQRSDFSLRMAPGLGHKSLLDSHLSTGRWLLSRQSEALRAGGHQTSPSWSARSGAAKRLASAAL